MYISDAYEWVYAPGWYLARPNSDSSSSGTTGAPCVIAAQEPRGANMLSICNQGMRNAELTVPAQWYACLLAAGQLEAH